MKAQLLKLVIAPSLGSFLVRMMSIVQYYSTSHASIGTYGISCHGHVHLVPLSSLKGYALSCFLHAMAQPRLGTTRELKAPGMKLSTQRTVTKTQSLAFSWISR